jgi:hypothetical protein
MMGETHKQKGGKGDERYYNRIGSGCFSSACGVDSGVSEASAHLRRHFHETRLERREEDRDFETIGVNRDPQAGQNYRGP